MPVTVLDTAAIEAEGLSSCEASTQTNLITSLYQPEVLSIEYSYVTLCFVLQCSFKRRVNNSRRDVE
jgi:hypothetical protein